MAKRLAPERVPTRFIQIEMACLACRISWKASAPDWYIDSATGKEHPCITAGHRVVRLMHE